MEAGALQLSLAATYSQQSGQVGPQGQARPHAYVGGHTLHRVSKEQLSL